jgi:hypothetical protein
MACKSFVFPFPLTFGSVLLVLVVAFAFLEFIKLLLIVVESITFFITLHTIVNLW